MAGALVRIPQVSFKKALDGQFKLTLELTIWQCFALLLTMFFLQITATWWLFRQSHRFREHRDQPVGGQLGESVVPAGEVGQDGPGELGGDQPVAQPGVPRLLPVLPLQPRVWVSATSRGTFHTASSCYHIRGRPGVKGLVKCEDCA